MASVTYSEDINVNIKQGLSACFFVVCLRVRVRVRVRVCVRLYFNLCVSVHVVLHCLLCVGVCMRARAYVLGSVFTANLLLQHNFVCVSLCVVFRAVWLNIPGLILVVSLCVLDGLVIFAVYSGCDLKENKKVTSNDQVRRYRPLARL